ncbi:MAG: hypothetical protein AB1742_12010 [bacterium]
MNLTAQLKDLLARYASLPAGRYVLSIAVGVLSGVLFFVIAVLFLWLIPLIAGI